VHWARQTLALAPPADVNAAARQILSDYLASETAEYQATKMPDTRYTQPSKKALEHARWTDKRQRKDLQSSGTSLEEFSPTESVANTIHKAIEMLFRRPNCNTHWFTMVLEQKVGIGAKGIGVEGSEYDASQLASEAPIYYFKNFANDTEDLNAMVQLAANKGIITSEQAIQGGQTPQLDKLKTRKVEYINNSADRAQFVLHPQNGKIVQSDPNSNAPYSTANCSTNFSGKGFAIFVMDEDGQIYASSHMMSQFHHSSFLGSSMPAAGAGEIKVEDGKLTLISNKSGHFKPSPYHLAQAVREFAIRFNQTEATVRIFGVKADGSTDWTDFGNTSVFWNLYSNQDDFTGEWQRRGFTNDPYAT
jgi:hypothetical protein